MKNGSFERLGETITKNVDVRIISATNVNLDEAINLGKFRQDLYYRLNTVTTELPPLRERKEDIPFLVDYFLKKYSVVYNKNVNEINDNALDILLNWNWHGNIRELENVIEFALIRTRLNKLCVCCLPQKLRGNLNYSSKVDD